MSFGSSTFAGSAFADLGVLNYELSSANGSEFSLRDTKPF